VPAETQVSWQGEIAMPKVKLSDLVKSFQFTRKAQKVKEYKGVTVNGKSPHRWAEYARKHHTGDLLACQFIFLGAISQRTVDTFVQKVRDEIDTDQKIALPTERELEQAQEQDRIGTGLPTKFWVKGV